MDLPDVLITIQEIYDQFRTYEARLANMDLGVLGSFGSGIIEAAGKFDLGGGLFTIISVRLLDDWRIAFADRPGPATIQTRITVGNIVGVISAPNEEVVAPSAFTFVTRALATTGGLVQDVTLYGGKTFEQVMQILLCMAQGRIVQTGSDPNVFELYAQDNTTLLYTLTQTATDRTRS